MSKAYNVTLFLQDDPSVFVQSRYFPETVTFDFSIEYVKIRIPGRRGPAHQWVAGGDKPIEFQMRFDDENRPGRKGSTCNHALAWFHDNMPPFDRGSALGGQQRIKHRPVFGLALFPGNPGSRFSMGPAVQVILPKASVEVLEWRRGVPTRMNVDVTVERHYPLIVTSDFGRTITAVDPSEVNLTTVSAASPEASREGAAVPGLVMGSGLEPAAVVVVPNPAWEASMEAKRKAGRQMGMNAGRF